ncbi:MAG: integrase [Rhodospirillaceae bacterium BRH_c57]|nr:MAG: integrase [Rhodospirillaceae bacterium BRH_c57]
MGRSFRSAEKQAAAAVSKVTAFGQSRHENKGAGRIHSVGTARSYEQSLRGFQQWRMENGFTNNLSQATQEQARAYLAERSQTVSQSTLDRDRQAISRTLGNVSKLDRVDFRSTATGGRDLAHQSRAYTPEQVQAIGARQSDRNALATQVAAAGGLRAHEILTLRPADERGPSTHREWSQERGQGREGVSYTVAGKGGLVREVTLPQALAERLEAARLATPQITVDRVTHYEQHYNIGGGQSWSQSFSAASKAELGWSTGAHGLRHSFAQDRLVEHQSRGLSYDAAREAVAQEVGHFDADTTNAYLR